MSRTFEIEPALIGRYKAGDITAFRQLVEVLMKPAYHHALMLTGNHEDALDMSQEAFIRAWKHRASVDAGRPFFPWFYTLLRRLCLNNIRNNSRRKDNPERNRDQWLEPVDYSTPHDITVQHELSEMVSKALGMLGLEDREIITLKDLQGYSYKEISEILSVPAGTVMSRLYTARQRFKVKMKEVGYETV